METKKLTITVLRGFNYSGKSKYAKDLCVKKEGNVIIVNRDEITKNISSYWNPKTECLVNEIEESIIFTALDKGFNVIIDDQNLSEKRDRFINKIKKKYENNKCSEENNIQLTINYVDFKKPLYKILYNNLIKKITFQKSMNFIVLIYLYNNYKQKLSNGIN